MGVAESKSAEDPSPPPSVLLDTESSEEENIEIINILKNVRESDEADDDQNVIKESGNATHDKSSEKPSDVYSEMTKYGQSFWNFVTTTESSKDDTVDGDKEDHLNSLLGKSDDFDLFGLSRSLTAQVDTFVKGLSGREVERPPSVGLFDQFPDGLGGSSKNKIIAPTDLTISMRTEFLRSIQEETPQQITEVKISESYTEGNGNIFSLTELVTGISSTVLEPEIENLIANPQRTVIWQSDTALLIRFGSSKHSRAIVIDVEGTPSEEDYLSVCALFQEYRTKPCFELIVPSADGLGENMLTVHSLRIWFEVINLSLFVQLKEDLVDLYDEDLLYVLPVPVFEHCLLFQWDFVHRFANVSGSVRSDDEDGTISLFRCIYEHLTGYLDSDAVFIYIRELLQFIQKSGVLNAQGKQESSTIFGGGIVVVLRYLNHVLPEEKHKLLLRADIQSSFLNGVLGSPSSKTSSSSKDSGSIRCYYEEFLPQDDSRPLLQPLGQICLHSRGDDFFCSYKSEAVVQSRQELLSSGARVNWKELLSVFYR